MKPEKVKIEIWGDVVCTFCLIGQRKLEQAIAKLNAQDQIEIISHSFQLDPDFPKNGSMPLTKYLSEKQGYSIEQIYRTYAQLINQGKEYDIDFQFDKAIAFDTFDAHRLIQWAKTLKKSHELKEAFMNAYFSNGIDLSLHENLVKVAGDIGLDTEKAIKILKANSYAQEVEQDIYQAKQLGIRGVPYFLINGTEAVPGTQNNRVFEDMISVALMQLNQDDIATQEGVCLQDGGCK